MFSSGIPIWIKILSALLTLVLSVIATLIIIFQYLLQKNRWRLDLFDKRYDIYERVGNFLSQISQHREIADEQLFSFLRETKTCEFLFNKEINSFIDDLYKKALKLNSLEGELKFVSDDNTRNKIIVEQTKIAKWFGNQFEESRKLFGKYLTITKK